VSSTAAPPPPTTLPPTTSTTVPVQGAGGATTPSAPAGERPEWIPEKYWDPATKKPRIEDLGKAYVSLEAKLGKGKEAWESERVAKRPEAADKYDLAIDGFSPEFLAAHPLTPVVREIAFESGLDQEGFKGLAAKVVGALAAAAPKPEEELAKLGENASVRVAAAEHFVTQTFTDPAEREALALVATTAAGVKVIEKLAALAQGKPLAAVDPVPNPGGAARKTRQEITKMMEDPRYWNPRQRDEAWVKEVTEWFNAPQ
jgi:hypothetical protein